MALAFGNKVISKVYFGEKAVSAIYLGTKKVFPDEEGELPETGDIRLRIETTAANQLFRLFYRITTEEGGYISVDWGDGNKETLTGNTTYQPTHTYATAGEYIVKLTGSKFTRVNGNTDSYDDFQDAVREILSLKMPTDSTSVSLDSAFYGCDNLTGNIPAWDDCIVSTSRTYEGCTGLTGNIPEWGANITNANSTYDGCVHLTGNIPEWGANITYANSTYDGCVHLTGNIPEWGANITSTYRTYYNCSGLSGCSAALLQDSMPSRITIHGDCVLRCADAIRQHFAWDWGGTKGEMPGSGDIRLRIETTAANQLFRLFYRIWTEEGGYISVDWGDGNKETFTDQKYYIPTHTYATAGEYIVKLTGSKFTEVGEYFIETFIAAVREILSLKMPTDSTSVSLDSAFYGCTNLTGNIPEWDDCIVSTSRTYEGCTGLTGNIPEWGANIENANWTYRGCSGLTGNIPEWGMKIQSAAYTYERCKGLTGNIPKWGINVREASYAYSNCKGLTGEIPEWRRSIRYANGTYNGCSSLVKCSWALSQDPMPSRITDHAYCVSGCVDRIRQHFTPEWGGTKTS